jgi:RNA polymerase sigma-70 factor (ECF subfamily)
VKQDELYEQASALHGRALERLVYAYEADAGKRADLLQEIHIALWRSFKKFEDRCSLRTWVYRIAHNAASSYVTRQRRANSKHLVSLEEFDSTSEPPEIIQSADQRLDAERLLRLIHRLRPIDRQIMLLYLEDMDAASIGEIVGISTNNVRVQIHRIKKILSRRFHGGDES